MKNRLVLPFRNSISQFSVYQRCATAKKPGVFTLRGFARPGIIAVILTSLIQVNSFGYPTKLNSSQNISSEFATTTEQKSSNTSVDTILARQTAVESIQTPVAGEINVTEAKPSISRTRKLTAIVPDYVPGVDLKPIPEGDGDLEEPGVIKAPADVVVVKFVDDKYRIRLLKKDPRNPLEKGYLKDLNGSGLVSNDAQDALNAVSEGQWGRSFAASEKEIDELRAIAMKRVGGKEHFADLNNYFALKLPKDMSREEAREIFMKLGEVEDVFDMPDLYTANADDYSINLGTSMDGGQAAY